MSLLVERARAAFTGASPLESLFDQDTIALLGLTPGEVKVIAALILTKGRKAAAQELAAENGVSAHRFVTTIDSLLAKELVAYDPAGDVTFEPAERVLRVQHPGEVEAPEGEAPGVKLVLQPLTSRVIAIARSQQNQAAALGRVFQFVFGRVPKGKDFALLGLMAKELGVEKSALLMLEQATNPSQTLLHDLVAMARARAKGFRPADAPDENQQRRFQAMLSARAREQRKSLGLEE